VTYSRDNLKLLLWLIPIAVGAFFIVTGTWLHNLVLDGSDKQSRLYTTALKVENKDHFNYAIETKQGNMLAWAEFKAKTPVKYPEMNQGFLAVEKIKEEYTRHETQNCSTDANGNQHCYTSVTYSWDSWGGQKVETPEVIVNDRDYPASLFDFTLRDIKASEIIPGVTDDEFYPNGKGHWLLGESVGDIRYVYKVVDANLSGSIFVNTSNGTLSAYNGGKINVSPLSVKERIENEQKNATLQKWFFIVMWTVLTIGAIIGSIYLLLENFF
jgi:hypothetical protein